MSDSITANHHPVRVGDLHSRQVVTDRADRADRADRPSR